MNSTSESRVEQWRRKLLDLSLRFPLFAARDEQASCMKAVKDNLDGLRLAMVYLDGRGDLVKAGCAPFLRAMEAGSFAVEDAVNVFDDPCSEKTLNAIMAGWPAFSGIGGIFWKMFVRFEWRKLLIQHNDKA